MSEHTKIDYQIIEQDGKPAFAVVPYVQFKAFIDKTEDVSSHILSLGQWVWMVSML